MEGGAALFRKPLKIVYKLEGDIDGTKFNVSGEGTGNAETGTVEAKYRCTSGELPTDWASIATTLGYGMKCFAKYPGGIKDMFKSCFPDGYTQDREITHENDGVYKTHAEITYKDGVIYNKTILKGEGFKKDGHVLGKSLASVAPLVSYVIPDGKGIQVKTNMAYKLKTGGFLLGSTAQTNQKLGFGDDDIPMFHYLYSRILLAKDTSEVADHIILKETVIATDPNVVERSLYSTNESKVWIWRHADIPKFHYRYSRILLSKDTSEVEDHIILKETVIAGDPNVVERSEQTSQHIGSKNIF